MSKSQFLQKKRRKRCEFTQTHFHNRCEMRSVESFSIAKCEPQKLQAFHKKMSWDTSDIWLVIWSADTTTDINWFVTKCLEKENASPSETYSQSLLTREKAWNLCFWGVGGRKAYNKPCRALGAVWPDTITVTGAIPENRGFQKMEIQFFLQKIVACGQVLAKSHSIGDYKNAKTCRQSMSLTEKTEFYFFHVPIFGYCQWREADIQGGGLTHWHLNTCTPGLVAPMVKEGALVTDNSEFRNTRQFQQGYAISWR